MTTQNLEEVMMVLVSAGFENDFQHIEADEDSLYIEYNEEDEINGNCEDLEFEGYEFIEREYHNDHGTFRAVWHKTAPTVSSVEELI